MTIRRSDPPCVLEIPLKCRAPVVISDDSGMAGLSGLGELLGLRCRVSGDETPEARVSLMPPSPGAEHVAYRSRDGSLALIWEREQTSFRIACRDSRLRDRRTTADIWHYAVLCAMAAAALRRAPILAVHGAMLSVGGSALLLFGESGVGKSTTARRWKNCGHPADADDMLLLEYDSKDGFFVHALPTWSRCRTAADTAETYPVAAAVPVLGVLGLSRGEVGEYIETVSRADFFGSAARSCFFHNSGILRRLPEPEQKKFARHIGNFSNLLAERFPPCGFFARPGDDIEKTIRQHMENIAAVRHP